MAWHNLVVPDAKPKLAATLAALGSGQYDGHIGIIRIGSGIDAYIEEFVWDSAARGGGGGWVGKDEHIVMVTDDAWALDWTRQPISALRNAWARPNGGVGWARAGAAAIVRGDFVVPASGTFEIPVKDYGVTGLPPQGQLSVRSLIFAYTGLDTTLGAKKFTGVTLVFGAPGVTLYGDYTPIIPYAPTEGGGGDPGGWGTTPFPLDHVGEMWAAGFRLEERMQALMNGSQDLKRLSIAPWYLNYNLGEDFDYPALQGVGGSAAPPPSTLLGPGVTLLGTDQPLAGIGPSGGTGTVIDERSFNWVESNWVSWTPPSPPTKRVLVPVLYGRMPADAKDNGQAYSVTLALRWVQP